MTQGASEHTAAAFSGPVAVASDEAALSDLFREHAPFVWRTLRSLGFSPSDADDLSQEVFLVVLQRLSDFEGRSSLRTWIYGIAVRVARAHRRRASTRCEKPYAAPPEGTTTSCPQNEALDREAWELLRRALDELDDDKRAVFVLFEIEQLPMTEVASALECPPQTAYSRLYAAREHVQSFMRRASRERWAG
ncbi:MAG: RNA polymerase sigma factor [Polyangiaceae bacterium]